MSEATPATGAPEGQRKKGFINRVKTILRRSDGSKRLSSIFRRTPVVANAPTSAEPSAPQAAIPTPAPIEAPEPVTETADPEKDPKLIKVLRSEVDADRARKLAERFKLRIEPNEWTTARAEKEAFRIEKPIRMRIHRTCHRCTATFTGNKECPACQHTRCSKCLRYPPKKDKSGQKTKEITTTPRRMAGEIEVDNYLSLSEHVEITMPSKTGGQPLVRKKPMQRVRRTCHLCTTMFSAGTKVCSTCSHIRCTDCPRDPPKRKKYPDGYPGDQHSATSTSPIKYECHHCLKVFPPVPHPNSPEGLALGDTIEPMECSRCHHPRCPECRRAPPRKVEPAPDLEVVKSVEAKLAALNLSTPEA